MENRLIIHLRVPARSEGHPLHRTPLWKFLSVKSVNALGIGPPSVPILLPPLGTPPGVAETRLGVAEACLGVAEARLGVAEARRGVAETNPLAVVASSHGEVRELLITTRHVEIPWGNMLDLDQTKIPSCTCLFAQILLKTVERGVGVPLLGKDQTVCDSST